MKKQIKEEEKNGIEKDEEQDIKNQKKNFMKMMFNEGFSLLLMNYNPLFLKKKTKIHEFE
jgi:hypothetical protein